MTRVGMMREMGWEVDEEVNQDKNGEADWLYAVQLGQLSWVELSCVAINTPLDRQISSDSIDRDMHNTGR